LIDNDVIVLLNKDLQLTVAMDLTEDQILEILRYRISEMLIADKDLLMSYLYRLDIPMDQIAKVLRVTNIIPAEESLARLILTRQIQRIKTKKKYKQNPIKGWEF
jgi:nitrate reductase beta subunit